MDSFSSLMEFAVAIAGFSGITMAVQARNTALSEVQSFRNTNLINFSLSAAFGSVIPQACAHLGQRISDLVLVERTLCPRVHRAAVASLRCPEFGLCRNPPPAIQNDLDPLDRRRSRRDCDTHHKCSRGLRRARTRPVVSGDFVAHLHRLAHVCTNALRFAPIT